MKHGYHEPVTATFKVIPGQEWVTRSRRKLPYDKAKLREPVVQARMRQVLTSVILPPLHIEQSSRAFIVDKVLVKAASELAPRGQRGPKQQWISQITREIIEKRNAVHVAVNKSGRALKAIQTDPIAAYNEFCRFLPAEGGDDDGRNVVTKAVELADRIRADREVGTAALEGLNATVKTAVKMDKAAFVCRRAVSLAEVAEDGLTPNLHRAIKPLKIGFKLPRLLLENHEGSKQ